MIYDVTLQVGESSSIGNNYVNEGVQVSLVSATFPQQLEKNIGDVLPVCMIYYCQLGLLLLGNKSQFRVLCCRIMHNSS